MISHILSHQSKSILIAGIKFKAQWTYNIPVKKEEEEIPVVIMINNN